MRSRIFAVLVVAILAGGGLAYGTYNFMQNQAASRPVSAATQPVVVASADLQLGTELKREDLTIANFPAGQVPQGTFSQVNEVVGRGLIVPLVKNEPVLGAKLATKEAGAGLPPVIPEGMRAVSVRVNEVVGVAGYVLPGTRVDVVATVNPTQQQPDVTSKVVLTNVLVLAAGTKIERDAEGGKPLAVSVVTLLVDPIEAERLTLASTEGKIQLALRNPLDKTAPVTPGIKPAALMGAAVPSSAPRLRSTPRPAAPQAAAAPVVPAPMPTVEIIRGDKRAQEVVR